MKPLHPIDAFGICEVTLSSIRVDRLEQRVEPKVPFPHKHDFYQFILITAGGGEHQIDFKKYSVSKNQIYLMKPGQIHTWSLRSGIKGYVVEFNHHSLQTQQEQNLDLIAPLEFIPDLMSIKKEADFETLMQLGQMMHKESQQKSVYQDISLKSLLNTFLIQIIRLSEARISHKAKNESVLEEFRHLVEHHFQTEHRVEFYAKKLGMTPKALTMQLSRLIKKSPRDVIQDRFLLEAKRYLAYSEMSIAEIGYAIGFEDANYFTRFFRQHEKITPAQFRKKFSITY